MGSSMHFARLVPPAFGAAGLRRILRGSALAALLLYPGPSSSTKAAQAQSGNRSLTQSGAPMLFGGISNSFLCSLRLDPG
jgi:hypothetical protein